MSTIHWISTRPLVALAAGSLVLAAVPSGHRISRATPVKSKVDWLQFGFDLLYSWDNPLEASLTVSNVVNLKRSLDSHRCEWDEFPARR